MSDLPRHAREMGLTQARALNALDDCMFLANASIARHE